MKKVFEENRERLFFDCVAGLIYLAFSIESVVNYIGSVQVKEWKERQPFSEKRKLVFKHLDLDANDFAKELEAVNALMAFRDTLVQARPTVLEKEEEFEIENIEEAMVSADLEPIWHKFATEDQFFEVYDLIKGLNKAMSEKTGIPLAVQLDGENAHITMMPPDTARKSV